MIGSIRQAKIGDACAVARILDDCRVDIGLKDKVTLADLERFADSVRPDHFPTWVIDADDVVIAVIVMNHINDGGRDILYLAVDPAQQGLRLGPRLIDFAVSKGWPLITTKAKPGNLRVAAVLQRKGFVVAPNFTDSDWVHFEWRPAWGAD